MTAPGPQSRPKPAVGSLPGYDFDLTQMDQDAAATSWSAAHLVGVSDVEVFVPGDGTPAGAGRRIGGFVIDMLISAAPASLAANQARDGLGELSGLAIGGLIVALIPVAMTWLWGLTPAKAMLGMKVIDARRGSAPGWRAIPRWLAYGGIIPVLTVAVPGSAEAAFFAQLGTLGVLAASTLFLLVDPQERSIPDRIAGTVVVDNH